MVELLKEQGLSLADVLLIPRYSDVLPQVVTLTSQFSRNVRLRIPVVSAAMDTLTDAKMATALAQLGGLGVIHSNFSIDKQVSEVTKCKEVQAQETAALAADGRLLVAAAVSPSNDGLERVAALLAAKCDVLVIDTAHGNSKGVIAFLQNIKRNFTDKHYDIVAGNVVTAAGAEALITAGVDAVKVGMGSGSICTTRVVTGVGVPQLSAILATSSICQKHNVPLISDGGLEYTGDIAKALAAGAQTVMLGRMLAGTDESAGECLARAGKKYKRYRGMGSLGAMQAGGSKRGYQHTAGNTTAEGVEGLVPYEGALSAKVAQLLGGLRAGMGYLGARNIEELTTNAQFIRVTSASREESHVHGMSVVYPSPNYK